MKFLNDFGVLFRRAVLGSLRNPVWLFIGMFQPVLYLLLFAPLLKGLNGIPGFPPGGAYAVFTPGLLVMLALFTTAFAGFGLVDQIRSGLIERLLVTPASRLSILLAFLARDVAVLLVQSTIAVLLALLLGLTVSLPGLLVTFGLMVLTGAVMAPCSYALAMMLKQEDSLASVINTVATPLMLLSGITL
ncbi:MAG TPA: ABC transporter permease, partial [bacterium]|nr:ABC transporter permease [bacterium]